MSGSKRRRRDLQRSNDELDGGGRRRRYAGLRIFGRRQDRGRGRGHGLFLSKILRANPHASGILFDLPHVAEGAGRLLGDAGLIARCQVLCGDFFTSVPAGCDAYVLKHILHDWDDARCERILSNCRAAMAPGGRVLVVEMVVPPPGIPSFARLIDLEMLAISSNGKERTEREFAELFAKAGLVLARVVPTQSPYSVLETFRT